LGKELMSQDEIAVMDGSKCILQVRGVRPFLSTKYDIEKHHNYQYLADADPKKAFNIIEFVKVFKENKAKLLEGLNRKNTNIVVIEIKDDEDVKPKDDEVKPKNETSTKPVPVPVPAEQTKPVIMQDNTPVEEEVPTETTETTEQANIQTDNITDNKTDNYEGEDDEDDSDDFDPDDTELV